MSNNAVSPTKEEQKEHWIPGLGEDRPKPRTLGTSFFGYVPDAFQEKTPFLPSERSAKEKTYKTDENEDVPSDKLNGNGHANGDEDEVKSVTSDDFKNDAIAGLDKALNEIENPTIKKISDDFKRRVSRCYIIL